MTELEKTLLIEVLYWKQNYLESNPDVGRGWDLIQFTLKSILEELDISITDREIDQVISEVEQRMKR